MKNAGTVKWNEPVRVLIAEDEAASAAKVERLITQRGFVHAGTARNGNEAVELCKSERPDVILMDVQMPQMDGLAATRRIQKICPTPVVVLTAYESPDFLEEASAVGVSAYLMKPPNAAEIERAITIALARHGDLMECKRLYQELDGEKKRLEEALKEIRDLREILPICSFCKKIRDDKGYWEQLEAYIQKHTGAKFSHSVCPDCAEEHYSDIE